LPYLDIFLRPVACAKSIRYIPNLHLNATIIFKSKLVSWDISWGFEGYKSC